MTNTTLILDSSVIAKWFFPEENNETALEIKSKFARNEITVAVPILLYYEINNLLRTAVHTFRIEEKHALAAYKSFLKFNLIVYSSELTMQRTLEIAIKFSISSYDAAYIALAEHLQVPFITADKKLLKKVSSKYIIDLDLLRLG